MNEQLKRQIDKEIFPHLSKDEEIKAAGYFRKVPSVQKLMLTRGFARFFSQEFLAAVTDKRLMLIPVGKINRKTVYGDVLNVDLKDVKFGNNFLSDLILLVRISGVSHHLKLRYEYGSHSYRMDKNHFMTALQNAQEA
jgi:hypothetical protein